MNLRGIYTLANDVVYDQLIALLNSIERNVGVEIPICVIPFDDRLDKIITEIQQRPQVSLFEQSQVIQAWENFAENVWDSYPAARKKQQPRPPWGKGHHRKFVAFDGIFEEFVYYDADSLAMKPLEPLFERLKTVDFVFDDWEHRKPEGKTALDLELMQAKPIYDREFVQQSLHCSSFFGSKRGIFSAPELEILSQKLIQEQEINWLPKWWDDAFLFNYLTLRSGRPCYNFTLSSNPQDRTGNCADADPFVEIDQVLYNEQGLKPIHRLHYMNYPAQDFRRLCQGEDVGIRYQAIFLYYRFLKDSDRAPQKLTPASPLQKLGRKLKSGLKKVQLLTR